MDNIFKTGGQVSGDSFIGRKKFVSNIRRLFLETKTGVAQSIVGLTRMGKTSAVKNSFLNELPDNVLYVYEDLGEWSNYNELWQDICLNLKDKLDDKGIDCRNIEDCLLSMESENIPWIKMIRNVKKIFGYLAESGLKVVLVLDEFDNARELFEETRHFELFRTIFSDGRYNVSAITVSRRNLYTIEGSTYQSSTFHGVLDVVPFKGFDDADMEEYFDVFGKNGVSLSEEQKNKIVYYAGNVPYLLSILGHYILNAAASNEDIDIDEIFLSKCKSINDYYRDCIEHLKRDDDLKRIIPFVIGPNVGVTKNDKDELFNLGYFRDVNGNLIVISEYFRDFLSANILQVDIWDNIISLEKALKQLIERELTRVVKHYSAGGTNINEIFKGIMEKTPGIEQDAILRYDKFILNNKKVFNIDSSYLDVMSMNDAVKIIKECWSDIFSAYFKNDLYSEWETKLNKCARARNPVAHGHEEYLSELDKQEVDTYCKQIFDMFADTVKEISPEQDSFMEAARKFTVEIPEVSFIAPTERLVGRVVDMRITGIGGASGSGKKNLKGVIDGKYAAFIPKNHLTGVIDLRAKLNHSVRVKIEKIVEDRYETSPVSTSELNSSCPKNKT